MVVAAYIGLAIGAFVLLAIIAIVGHRAYHKWLDRHTIVTQTRGISRRKGYGGGHRPAKVHTKRKAIDSKGKTWSDIVSRLHGHAPKKGYVITMDEYEQRLEDMERMEAKVGTTVEQNKETSRGSEDGAEEFPTDALVVVVEDTRKIPKEQQASQNKEVENAVATNGTTIEDKPTVAITKNAEGAPNEHTNEGVSENASFDAGIDDGGSLAAERHSQSPHEQSPLPAQRPTDEQLMARRDGKPYYLTTGATVLDGRIIDAEDTALDYAGLDEEDDPLSEHEPDVIVHRPSLEGAAEMEPAGIANNCVAPTAHSISGQVQVLDSLMAPVNKSVASLRRTGSHGSGSHSSNSRRGALKLSPRAHNANTAAGGSFNASDVDDCPDSDVSSQLSTVSFSEQKMRCAST
eukprot:Clim_evm17s64 gene=Clim_evmTU17s64